MSAEFTLHPQKPLQIEIKLSKNHAQWVEIKEPGSRVGIVIFGTENAPLRHTLRSLVLACEAAFREHDSHQHVPSVADLPEPCPF